MPKQRDRADLETGYTTGTCATAVTKSALMDFMDDEPSRAVTVDLPNGDEAELQVSRSESNEDQSTYTTIKDAGDDPDATDGATIVGTVERTDKTGIHFEGGDGVGTVTMSGMPVDKGEPAINPVPREMIRNVGNEFLRKSPKTDGLLVRIGVEGGREIAKNTLNPRLGIEDGLSILGTTGIVKPYSNASYVASIEQGIDVALANGLRELVLATGGRTEKYAMRRHDIPDFGYIQFAGFLQETLAHIQTKSVESLHVYMMPGKFSKLMQGHLKLHSQDSTVDMKELRGDIRRTLSPENGKMDAISDLQSVNQTLAEFEQGQIRRLMEVWVQRGLATMVDFLRGNSLTRSVELVILSLDGDVLGRETWSK